MNDLIDRSTVLAEIGEFQKLFDETGDSHERVAYASAQHCILVIKSATSVNQCISVKDALPDTNGEYLVYTDHYEIVEYDTELQQFGYTDKYIDEQGYNAVEWYEVHNVTHWMPLPKPPESEVQNG